MPIININSITDSQKLKIEIGLVYYNYIQNKYNKKQINNDFKAVFTTFYLSAQGKMRQPGNQKAFFGVLQKCNPTQQFINIVSNLQKNMPYKLFEFSFATKLFHTVDDKMPIYDSKVRKYLMENYKCVKFQHATAKYYKANSGQKLKMIDDDYTLLKSWYSWFLKQQIARGWIDWFDKNFPNYKNISNVKKIDFIIYACN